MKLRWVYDGGSITTGEGSHTLNSVHNKKPREVRGVWIALIARLIYGKMPRTS
jgi:hypothetical protein